ncbi:MAG: methylated-DNA--[protein]-cysteine S-methyltransferase [Anaerolineales bacterium]|nr:methylated-DNA--[protein]-cysteine S-methyltransferase [Anaerolineales bacterium]
MKIYIGEVSPTKLGAVWVALNERGLIAVEISTTENAFCKILDHRFRTQTGLDKMRTAEAIRQVHEYLDGKRERFDLAIDWSVLTSFQAKALKATCAIPYGETRTYGEIAAQVGNPHAARAVGRAEATNPMPLVIPCHRVIGADGGLRGYSGSGGLQTKAWLLRLEDQTRQT